MIIYQNGLITLDYSPATDVLHVELPNVVAYGITELERSFEIVTENIRNYDVKFLLIDSRKVLVEQMEDETYKATVGNFIANLLKTRLKKVARVNNTVAFYETRLRNLISETTHHSDSLLKTELFTSMEQAQQWLLGE